MKKAVFIGKPTHLRVDKPYAEWTYSACGLGARVLDAAYDPRDVDCVRCMKTNEFDRRMNGDTQKGVRQ